MKKIPIKKCLSLLLAGLLLLSAAGCASDGDHGSGSVDDPSTRQAELMGAKQFKKTFSARGDLTDRNGSSEEEETFLLAKNIDGHANLFNYIDATGEIDLADLEKEAFIEKFQNKLNQSGSYQYNDMELQEMGSNYYIYKVKIQNRESGEEKPELFVFVENGEKTWEIIAVDMEAENPSAFTDSFQSIVGEILTIKEVEPEKKGWFNW